MYIYVYIYVGKASTFRPLKLSCPFWSWQALLLIKQNFLYKNYNLAIMPLSQNPFELRLKSNVTQAAAEGFVNLLSSHNIEIDTFFSLNHDCKTIVYKFISREAKENALQIPNLDQKLSELNFQAINSIPQNFSHRDVFTRKINPAHFQLNDGETIDGKLLEFRSNLNRAVGADRVVHIHFHQDLGYGRKY